MLFSVAIQMASMPHSFLAELARFGIPIALGALKGAVSDDRRERLFDETLAERRGHTKRLARLSRGEFTPQEQRQTNQSPALQAIAQSATARGVTGPARQQLVARGQASLFGQQQAAALQALSPALSAQEQMISQLPQQNNDMFMRHISDIVQGFSMKPTAPLKFDSNGQGAQMIADSDSLMNAAVDMLSSGIRLF